MHNDRKHGYFVRISSFSHAPFCCVLADAKAVVTYLRHIATQFRLKNGYHIPVHVLASRMAERNQQHTQYAYLRMMCVVVTLVGIDEEKGPQVFKIDPAGSCYGYHACASGSKEQEAVNALEKQHKKKDGKFTTDEAI